MSENREVTYSQFFIEDHPGRFLMVRQVEDYATHWMNSEGRWVAIPDDDDALVQLFEWLSANTENLPRLLGPEELSDVDE